MATRDLRNKTADLLKRVEAGESMVITVRGKPVADLVPHRTDSPRWLAPDEVMEIVTKFSADPGLRDDLRRLEETSDELPPLW